MNTKNSIDIKLLLRYITREMLGIIIMGIALFWSAGGINWWPAWAAIIVMLAWIIATFIVILRFNPDLFAERLGPRKGARNWDIAIMSIVGIVQLSRYILAGLDQRYGWTGGFPLTAQLIALVTCMAAYFLVTWATASNAFFSQIVRIQTERGHIVVTNGPYRHIRHPAYTGAILYELALPFLLASWWALIPGVLNAILLIIRTYLEDRSLQKDLAGYTDYAHKVGYRLFPGIW